MENVVIRSRKCGKEKVVVLAGIRAKLFGSDNIDLTIKEKVILRQVIIEYIEKTSPVDAQMIRATT